MSGITAILLAVALGQAPGAAPEAQPSLPSDRPIAAPSPAPAPAEQPLPILTLEEALRIADQQNLDLQAARARLDQSQLLSRRVWANYLPRLSVAGSYTRNNVEARFGPIPPPLGTGEEIVIQPFDQWGAQVELNQALLVPALWPAIRNAYLAEDIAELSVESARREVLFGVAQLYYGAAGLKQSVAVQQRLLENAQAHERDARVRFEAGAVPKIQLIRAQIDVTRTEQDLRRAENALASARLALATLLGRKEADFDVVQPEVRPLVDEGADLEQMALEERPDVKVARANLELAERQRAAVYYQYAPNLVFNGAWRTSNVGGFSGEKSSWALTLALSWTLWDGGIREIDLKEAGARIVETRAQTTRTELQATQEVRQALLDLESARANRIKAEEQLRLARENMDLVNVNYASGVATQLEVSDAQAALASSELGLVAETLNADLAALRLAKAAGAFDWPRQAPQQGGE